LADISLRAVAVDDAVLLERWEAPEFTEPYNHFGMPRRRLHEAIAHEAAGADRGTLIIEADGEPVGTVSWRVVRYGPNPESAAWNIGINVIPAARGRGLGSAAQRLLAERLFATTPCNRIEAGTDVENIAEQRALEKAGFVREGALRGAQSRRGEYHDLVLYSRLRGDR
jgi:RimJ/RimL family protein N-acetyltransferase